MPGTGNKAVAAESLEGLACADAARGEAEHAARLFGAAETLRRMVGYRRQPTEKARREPYLTAVRSRLDEAVVGRAALLKGGRCPSK